MSNQPEQSSIIVEIPTTPQGADVTFQRTLYGLALGGITEAHIRAADSLPSLPVNNASSRDVSTYDRLGDTLAAIGVTSELALRLMAIGAYSLRDLFVLGTKRIRSQGITDSSLTRLKNQTQDAVSISIPVGSNPANTARFCSSVHQITAGVLVRPYLPVAWRESLTIGQILNDDPFVRKNSRRILGGLLPLYIEFAQDYTQRFNVSRNELTAG